MPFFNTVALALVTTVLLLLVSAAPADAVLVYQGSFEGARQSPIVAARNDGSDARVIGRGLAPQV